MRACLPVLAKQEGCQSGDHSSYTATESPPGVLDQKSHQNQDSTKYPVHELEHHGFVWREERSRVKEEIK